MDSVDFRLKLSKKHPTVPTRVIEPKKSIRRSFVVKLWFFTSGGISIDTLQVTRVKENRRMGIFQLIGYISIIRPFNAAG